MEAWLEFLDREGRIYDNARATILLDKWRKKKRLDYEDFSEMRLMKLAARVRDKLRKDRQKARHAALIASRLEGKTIALRELIRERHANATSGED